MPGLRQHRFSCVDWESKKVPYKEGIMEEELKDDLSNYNKDAYEKPSVTVDICICSIIDNDLKILLIKRKHPPFRNSWAIPGGFVEIPKRENLEQTAARELREETGLKNIYLEQLKTYGGPNRDPRMRVITVSYFALVPYNRIGEIKASSDAKQAQWFSLRSLPKLAFDHKSILKDLLDRLKGKILYSPIAFSLVPREFTWTELQRVYEIVLGESIKPANFRRKIKAVYVIESLNEKSETRGRPALKLRYKSMNSF